jgi:hypothetical protein
MTTPTTGDDFSTSIDELMRFAENLKSTEKEHERRHATQLAKQKAEFDILLQKEKKRADELEQINRTLTQQIEQLNLKYTDLEQKHTVNA